MGMNQNMNPNMNSNMNSNMNNNMRGGNGITSCRNNNIKGDKCACMNKIYELGFTLTETMLYLDTHPDDLEAIEFYTEIKEKYSDALRKFADYQGPMNITNMTNDNYWMWVATPMPWEMEGCQYVEL